MILSVPQLGQRDPKWSNKRLGTSNSTIGGYGCLVTALAMACRYYGKDTDPDRLNEALKGVGGYANQNLYIWGSVSKIFQDFKETKNIDTPKPVTQAQWTEIKAELDAGRPVILEVDMIPATTNVDMHFVCLVGYEGDKWIVNDPWYGDQSSLTRYGVPEKTVQKYVFTSGTVPPKPSSEWLRGMFLELGIDTAKQEGEVRGRVQEVIDGYKRYKELETKINKISKDLAYEAGQAAEFEKRLQLSESNVRDLQMSLQEARDGLSSRDLEISRLSQAIDKLNEAMNPDIKVIISKDEYARLIAKKQIDRYSTGELLKEVIQRLFKRGGVQNG